MSRSNKPRTGTWGGQGGGHTYRKGHHDWYKRTNNKRIRGQVRQHLKDVLFTDAFDEKEMQGKKKGHFWSRMDCC